LPNKLSRAAFDGFEAENIFEAGVLAISKVEVFGALRLSSFYLDGFEIKGMAKLNSGFYSFLTVVEGAEPKSEGFWFPS
jgi:hypothetical protein